MKDKSGKNVRFIRIKGKIVPIMEKHGINKQNVKKRALSEYHKRVPEEDKETIKKAFGLGKKLFALGTAGITASVLAKHADFMVSKYEERVSSAEKKAHIAEAGGVVAGGTGLALLAKTLRKKALSKNKFGLAISLSLAGASMVAGGAFAEKKIKKHKRISKVLRKVSSEANKYLGGTSVFQDL
jgi:hypothetical protein